MDNTTTPGGINRRKFLGTAAVVGAGAALAACSTGDSASDTAPSAEPSPAATTYDGPPVTLAFWNGFTGGDGPYMKKIVQDFNAAHPNITIKDNTIQWGDYYGKLATAVTSGNGPDVGVMHIDTLAGFAARKVLHPLDDLSAALNLTSADFDSVVWDAGTYAGARYGIPLDVHPLGFYYNKTLLNNAGITEAPTDSATWDAAIDAMKSAGVANPFWSTATWPAHLMFTALITQFGGTLYAADSSKATFNSDAGVAALDWLVKWTNNGVSPKNVSNDAQAQAFRQGKNALTWDGIWMMNAWAEVDGLEWGAAAIPQIGPNPGCWAGSHNLVVTTQGAKDENKLAAARVFLAYISENSLEWAKAGQVPARNSVRESADFAALPIQSELAKQLPGVAYLPGTPGINEATGPGFEKAVNQAILGKLSSKAALDEAAKVADKILADNLAKFGA
jgi:multiple sugar transport system substrate-binding protein